MIIAKYLNLYFIKDKISKLTFPFLYIIAKYLIVITSEEHLIIVIMDNCEQKHVALLTLKAIVPKCFLNRQIFDNIIKEYKILCSSGPRLKI